MLTFITLSDVIVLVCAEMNQEIISSKYFRNKRNVLYNVTLGSCQQAIQHTYVSEHGLGKGN